MYFFHALTGHYRLVAQALLVCCLLLATNKSSYASTVADVSFADLLTQSALVFEGEVVSVSSEQGSGNGIVTIVRFYVRDVIKGNYDQSHLNLSFLGGRLENRVMHVPDMQIPEVGEHGVYFVHDIDRQFVNPLVGWAQGHFLINDDPGQTLLNAAGEPVTDVQLGTGQQPLMIMPDTAQARGVTVRALNSNQAALTLPAFKQRIRELTQQVNAP